MITAEDVRVALRRLDLSGTCLCVHSSLRSFGTVEGGAKTIVSAILDEGCTLLVPSFSHAYFVPPPDIPELRPERNGWDYARRAEPGAAFGSVYSSQSNLINISMGAIPAAVLATEGRVRGDHPLNSFVAVGSLAAELVTRQSSDAVYAPLEALAKAGGWVVLMGVGLTSLTLVHYAEQLAGRTPFRRWALSSGGGVTSVAYGGCSNGFDKLEPVIAPLVRHATAGQSVWRAYPRWKP
jgi:aminoglycoside N3'-acetyltransferase